MNDLTTSQLTAELEEFYNEPLGGQAGSKEWYFQGGLYTFCATVFLWIVIVSLVGNKMGNMPRYVVWELDNILGPMLGFKTHYSIFAGIWNLIAVILTYFVWGTDHYTVDISVFGMAMIWKYLTV